MTKDEALRLALEAFNDLATWNDGEVGSHMDEPYSAGIAREAITAIKTALEAKDEPWEQFYPEMGKPKLAYLSPTESLENACYIPPQRTWVGLTDAEILAKCESVPDYDIGNYDLIQFAKAIEAKLKEKNESKN